MVLREIMSLTAAHSKSTVPAAVLDDPAALRRLMMRSVFTDLEAHKNSGGTPDAGMGPIGLSVNMDRYDDPMTQAYAWLVSAATAHERLVDDVIDAVRVLRAADGLRQRGTSLRTAAGYEMFIAAATGSAVYALRNAANTELVLMRSDDEKSAGEANVRVAVVTENGHLRLAFHRGAFTGDEACARAASAAAVVVADIQADVLPTFAAAQHASGLPRPTRRATDMLVELERPADRPAFADEVAAYLVAMHPELDGRVEVILIPGELYEREWFRPYEPHEIASVFRGERP
ncbi:MAG: hypothetical protein ABI862_06700 [Ilumatobacteraceae bacterium]